MFKKDKLLCAINIFAGVVWFSTIIGIIIIITGAFLGCANTASPTKISIGEEVFPSYEEMVVENERNKKSLTLDKGEFLIDLSNTELMRYLFSTLSGHEVVPIIGLKLEVAKQMCLDNFGRSAFPIGTVAGGGPLVCFDINTALKNYEVVFGKMCATQGGVTSSYVMPLLLICKADNKKMAPGR